MKLEFNKTNANKKDTIYCSNPGLQMTDVELDERVTALEENGGVGPQNGKLRHDKFLHISFYISCIFLIQECIPVGCLPPAH